MIWDGASYHKYGEFRDFLSSVNRDKEPSDWSITCILFAPNAPQQNPVEDIWLQAKNFLRKYWYLCRSFKIIKFLFELFTKEHKFDFPKIHQYTYIAFLIKMRYNNSSSSNQFQIFFDVTSLNANSMAFANS